MNIKEIGARIADARKKAGYKTGAQLAAMIYKNPNKGGVTIGAETVRLWESGEHPPPLDKLKQLAAVLKVSEQWLLFGFDSRRGEQLRAERRHLQYISDIENELLTVLRQADPKVHADILNLVKTMAKNNPSQSADVLKMLRKK